MESRSLLTKRKIESLAMQYEISDPVLKQVFLQNLRNKHSNEYDVFLSHSNEDNDFIKKLLVFLKYAKGGIDGYVDWNDSQLPSRTNRQTAERLADRIRNARKFIFIATSKSLKSVWCSWELGYAERDKGIDNIAVLAAKPNNGHWKNNEYLQQYPWIEYNEQKKLFLVYMPNGSTVLLSDWLMKANT